jgi:hypothetical protein
MKIIQSKAKASVIQRDLPVGAGYKLGQTEDNDVFYILKGRQIVNLSSGILCDADTYWYHCPREVFPCELELHVRPSLSALVVA